jgi:hypothetical protein
MEGAKPGPVRIHDRVPIAIEAKPWATVGSH